jgi:hypothetical protein
VAGEAELAVAAGHLGGEGGGRLVRATGQGQGVDDLDRLVAAARPGQVEGEMGGALAAERPGASSWSARRSSRSAASQSPRQWAARANFKARPATRWTRGPGS